MGGGLAAAATAERYRQEGGTGTVAIFTQEPDLPVHRPPLSKGFLRGDEAMDKVFVHSEAFYGDNQIAVRLNTRVDHIDLDAKSIRLEDGEHITWEKLVLATGARPRRLRTPGADLAGIYYLRSLGSARELHAAYTGAQTAVIIGAGFIGMEVAATLTAKGIACTVVEMGARIWPGLVPEATTSYIQQYFESKGVRFCFNSGVAALAGEGRIQAVTLADGSSLPADLVVAGVGAVLNTELAEDAGLTVDRGVVVDQFFTASHLDVYAVGDIASFPDQVAGRIHLEHWDNALAQGCTLAKTLAGHPEPFQHVAYFFSDLFDLSLNMVGYPSGWDDIAIRGDVATGAFTTVYLKEGKLRAALMINDDAEFDRWTEMVAAGFPVADPQALTLA